jgi:hypothetical protein
VVFALGAAAIWVLRRRVFPEGLPRLNWRRVRRRYSRPFPLAFAILAGLAILGGALYGPSNYDALSYRVPRMLHWLAAGQWHWVHTDFARLNTRACGVEWLSVPLIVFSRSDRLLFLISAISLLLLPGLFFSLFTRLGMRRRVSWYWMWLLPAGYCYLLQAGSIANDLFGAVFSIAAVDFALRARQSRKLSDLWLSALAAALLTGSKASNLPLLLPWLIALLPSLNLLRRRLVPTLGVALVAVLSSVLPVLVMNAKFSGDWTGTKVEHANSLEGTSPLRVVNNAVVMTLQNLVPPVFPFTDKWNRAVERVQPAAWRARMEELFEPHSAHWCLPEMQVEEAAGLGFGVSLLLLISLAASFAHKAGRNPVRQTSDRLLGWAIVASTWISLLVFTAKTGMSGPVRHAAPYYPLLIPVLLMAGSQARLVRARWWRLAALGSFGLAGFVLVLSPARPLWPALTVCRALGFDRSTHGLGLRAWTVYSVYRQRTDAFQPVRALLPAQANPLGLITSDDPETSLWFPFGSRQIMHVCRGDSPAQTRKRGIGYVLVSVSELTQQHGTTVDAWLRAYDAEVLNRLTLRLRAGAEASDWVLAKLR